MIFRINYGPSFQKAQIERRGLYVPAALSALEGRSVLFITDLHISRMFPADCCQRLFDQCRSLDPDLVLWGGDFSESMRDLNALPDLLSAWRPRLGMVACPGNNDIDRAHQYGRSLKSLLRTCGITLLRDTELLITDGSCRLRVAGLDFFGRSPRPVPFFAAASDSEYRIVLSHYPQNIWISQGDFSSPPDLGLCGHTHGGQFALGALTPYSFGFEFMKGARDMPVVGWTDAPGFPTLISPGIGTSRLPFRLNRPPTVHLLTFCTEKDENAAERDRMRNADQRA